MGHKKKNTNKKHSNKKNRVQAVSETLTLDIDKLGAQGDGVAEHEGVPVYVPFSAPGDRVEANVIERGKSSVNAEISKLLTESPYRAEPACQHFGTCGGCQLQYLTNDYYAEWLMDRAKTALSHQGFEGVSVSEARISPVASRRRVALKALHIVGGVALGFNERQSHQITNLSECPITRVELTSLFDPIRQVLAKVLHQREQAEVHMTLTAAGVDLLVKARNELNLQGREDLVDFVRAHDIAALHWEVEGFLDPVLIARPAVMDFSGIQVPLPPASFIQATAEGEAALVDEVLAATANHKRVADLFAGIGTFSFPLARHHQVLAVEGAKASLDALQAAVNRAGSDLKQIVPLHRDLFRRPLTAKELSAFDAVVFDPPRTGAKEQAEEIAQSDVKTVVAVSCNPNTFSRDARILVDGGYDFEKLVPVDQFLWSPHLELVGVFRK